MISPLKSDTGDVPTHSSAWVMSVLVVMFLFAALLRMDDIKAPGHLLDREYTSAIFARAFYFQNNNAVESWRRDIAGIAMDQQPVLEPPIQDYLVSLIYRVIGREELHFARYLMISFWLVGGVFMFLIAQNLLSSVEALVATGYYLFVPMGIIISRSFQPDSLMMMMFLISLYLVIRYFEVPTTARLLLVALITGVTLFLRPLVLFAILFAFLALSYHRKQDLRKLIDVPLLIFGTLSLMPFVTYYGYGIMFAGFMRWKVATTFMPYLLNRPDFWVGWFNNVVSVAKTTPLVLAVIGLAIQEQKRVRYLALALAASFLVFTVVFTYHIHTHPYYHIQLFPLVALCMAPFVVRSMRFMLRLEAKIRYTVCVAVILLVAYSTYQEVHESLYHFRAEDPVVAEEIGQIVEHSPRTVFVAYHYGLPLGYYGEFGGAPWPVRIEDEFYRSPGERELSVAERLDGLGFVPDYFVITNFDLFNRKHQDLQAYLEKNCRILANTSQYLIYETCHTLVTTSRQDIPK